jgi:hypothetical protein
MFVAAWVFFILVIAGGFFVQARTIDRLERDEVVIESYVTQVDMQQNASAVELCKLLVRLAPQSQEDIVATFNDLGYECPIPTG